METASDIRVKIATLDQLPPLPEMARKLLELKGKASPAARELAAAVEVDPSLSAQVIRYARSSLYGYRGSINSVDDAIARVLGYEMVLNLALGLAASRPFDLPDEGPIGARAYWSAAVRTAFLAQKIAFAAPAAARGNILPSMVYLSGLLHDFGLLVLAHLAPVEYRELNIELAADQQHDLVAPCVERFGVSHYEAGARALRTWDLPDELIVTALKYADTDYDGPHSKYCDIVRLAHELIDGCGEAEVFERDTVTDAMHRLKLHKETVLRLIEGLMTHTDDVEALARQLAA